MNANQLTLEIVRARRARAAGNKDAAKALPKLYEEAAKAGLLKLPAPAPKPAKTETA